MEFTFVLNGGPLDGFGLHGEEHKPPESSLDLGAIAYLDTNSATLGAIFETSSPDSSSSLPSLYRYRIIGKRLTNCQTATHVRERLVIDAEFVGPSAS
jgi:hypothetical protein